MKKYLVVLTICLGFFLVQGDTPPAVAFDQPWANGAIGGSTGRVSGAVIDDIFDKVDDIQGKVTRVDTRVGGINTRVIDINNSVHGPTGLVFQTNGLKERTIDTLTNTQGILGQVDGVQDFIQFVEEQRGKISPEMLEIIEDSLAQLQLIAEEELEGLSAFRGPSGDCSSSECIKFRSDISELFTNTAALYNAMGEGNSDLGITMEIDLSRFANFIEVLPAEGLYPMYRATKDSDVFGTGFVQLIGDLAEAIKEDNALEQRRAGADSLAAGPISRAECRDILHDDQFAENTKVLKKGGMALKQSGELLVALGKSKHVALTAAAFGTGGVDAKLEGVVFFGTAIKGAGEVAMFRAASNSSKVALCTTLDAQDKCELEVQVDQVGGLRQGDTVLLKLRTFVFTTMNGVRTPATDHEVSVNGHPLPSPSKVEIIPVGVGIDRVDLEFVVATQTSVVLTVEGVAEGTITDGKPCSGSVLVQWNEKRS